MSLSVEGRTWKDDFSSHNGNRDSGLKNAAIYSFIYIGLPLLAYVYEMLTSSHPAVLDDVFGYIITFVLATLPLIPVAYVTGFYRPGNRARMAMKMFSAAYLTVLILILSRGGTFLFPVTEPYSYGSVIVDMMYINIDTTWLIWLSVAVIIAIGLISVMECRDNLDAYRQSLINENQ